MEIKIVEKKIEKEKLAEIASKQFGDLVKAVVDAEKEIMAIGGEMHADEEAALLGYGSNQKDLWGVNIYPQKPQKEWIEFNSMINVRPSQNNRSREVENKDVRNKIVAIVNKLIV